MHALMEAPSTKWSSELEMEEMNSLDYYSLDDELNFQSLYTETNSNILHCFTTYTPMETPHEPQTVIERPAKQLKTKTTWNSISPKQLDSSSSSHLISFHGSNESVKSKNEVMGYSINGNMNFPPLMISQDSYKTQHLSTNYGQGVKKPIDNDTSGILSRTTPNLHAKDHVIVERKRREKLTQKFIALSATLPGLKKMDKASVLGDALEYVKHLQERLKTLEEQATKKTVQSVVFVKRFHLSDDGDHISSSDHNDVVINRCYYDQPLPEVEARVLDKDVLIRIIHCEKDQGCLVKILNEIEKLHLSIMNCRVIQFGNSRHITIVAQMDVEFCMEAKELARNLRRAFLSFI